MAGIPRVCRSSVALFDVKVTFKSVDVTAISILYFVANLRITIYFLTDKFGEM